VLSIRSELFEVHHSLQQTDEFDVQALKLVAQLVFGNR
jgi:hypothetical protein